MILVAAFAVWASAIDARRRELPNRLLGPMALAALGCQALRQWGVGALPWLPWLSRISWRLAPPSVCAALALALALGLWTIEALRRRRGLPLGLGFGDVKLACAWTLALGSWGVLALALGCAAGGAAALARHRATFPLGPYLTGFALAIALALVI